MSDVTVVIVTQNTEGEAFVQTERHYEGEAALRIQDWVDGNITAAEEPEPKLPKPVEIVEGVRQA